MLVCTRARLRVKAGSDDVQHRQRDISKKVVYGSGTRRFDKPYRELIATSFLVYLRDFSFSSVFFSPLQIFIQFSNLSSIARARSRLTRVSLGRARRSRGRNRSYPIIIIVRHDNDVTAAGACNLEAFPSSRYNYIRNKTHC